MEGFRVPRLGSSSFVNEGLKRNDCLYRPHSQIAKQMFSCNNNKSESSASGSLKKKSRYPVIGIFCPLHN